MEWETLKKELPVVSKPYVVSVKVKTKNECETFILCIAYYNVENNQWYEHNSFETEHELSKNQKLFNGEIKCWIKNVISCG
jgi:hypothetical protein